MLREKSLADLDALTGKLWKEVRGELHAHYDEMPTWILLYDDSDLSECLARAQGILSQFMSRIAPVEFTLSFEVLDESDAVAYPPMIDNDEIMSATVSGLSKYAESRPRGPSIFSSTTSSRN